MPGPKALSFIQRCFSKVIHAPFLAGSLARRQDSGVVFSVYYGALARRDCWLEVISDHDMQSGSPRRVPVGEMPER